MKLVFIKVFLSVDSSPVWKKAFTRESLEMGLNNKKKRDDYRVSYSNHKHFPLLKKLVNYTCVSQQSCPPPTNILFKTCPKEQTCSTTDSSAGKGQSIHL